MARILLIDDERHIRTLVKAFLVQVGHEVDLAENGMEGLKLIERNRYERHLEVKLEIRHNPEQFG